jgi:hypothetical protein
MNMGGLAAVVRFLSACLKCASGCAFTLDPIFEICGAHPSLTLRAQFCWRSFCGLERSAGRKQGAMLTAPAQKSGHSALLHVYGVQYRRPRKLACLYLTIIA